MSFSFGTLCSGIESASEAFAPLGAECRYVSEIEPYPCGVLAVRHGAGLPMRMPRPEDVDVEGARGSKEKAKRLKERRARAAAIKAVERYVRPGNRIPNYGDLTQIDPDEMPAVDLLVAGFPCQDFSIAGLRASLAGARGNLTLFGVKLIHELARRGKLRSVLLEQVPDILNTKDNAFGALLAGLVGHDAPIRSPLKGGRWPNAGVVHGPLGTAAWRVEDAQYSGLAQRRERLFLVGSFGDGPDPVEVLLEREGLSRDPPARRKAGEGVTHALAPSLTASGRGAERTGEGRGHDPVIAVAFGGNNTSGPVELATARTASHTASGRQDFESETFIVEGQELAPTLRSMGHANAGQQVAVAFSLRGREDGAQAEVEEGDVCPSLRAADGGSTRPFVACATGEITHTLTAEGFDASEGGTGRGPPLAADGMAVRRITVVEAERLQGFRDNYTLIDWPTANRKGRDLKETISYLIGHGFTPEEAATLAQTPDGPRYKAIGNSKPVPTVRKIGAAYASALKRHLGRSAA